MRHPPLIILLSVSMFCSGAEYPSFWRGSEELPYQVGAGLGQGQDGWTNWMKDPRNQDGNWGLLLVEAARGWDLDGRWRLRAILHEARGSDGFSNAQVAVDVSRVLFRPWSMPIRLGAGLSLNRIHGSLRVHPGFLPPYGTGAFQEVDQGFRPGARLMLSFQPVKRFSFDLTCNYVTLATVGAGPNAKRGTTYGGGTASFRFGRPGS